MSPRITHVPIIPEPILPPRVGPDVSPKTWNVAFPAVKAAIKIITEPAVESVNKTVDFIKDRFSTPEKAQNTLSAIGLALDAAAAYCAGIGAGLAIPTFGISVATAVTASAVLALASVPFHIAALVIDFVNEEEK